MSGVGLYSMWSTGVRLMCQVSVGEKRRQPRACVNKVRKYLGLSKMTGTGTF